MNAAPVIYWLGNDLRLADNAALSFAARRGPIIPVYILDEGKADPHGLGGASKWWLHEALEKQSESYSKHGVELLFRRGASGKILDKLIKETGAKTITWNRRHEPLLSYRDEKIADDLVAKGIDVKIHLGYLLFQPETIRTGAGTPFKVFTPFSRACFAAPSPGQTLLAPKKLSGIAGLASDDLSDWKLVPPKAKWPKGLEDAWSVGEEAALKQLNAFIDKALPSYKYGRDRPDMSHTSRLSPYLHFGQISPRQVWHAIQFADARNLALGVNVERYLLELLWREFSWHLLHHVPAMPDVPLLKSFANFPWRKDAKALQAWQKGLTGYPIVDAGMRQLWETGWMHNRVRMITASFLIKDLMIDWREGAAWFWDTLLDADLASNSASWQWVAGCGADAAPYFRIFNPTLQGKKFDPEGDYVRRYVPELAKLDANYIHEPWRAPSDVLKKARVVLGKTYPNPIIDHAKARERALNALSESQGKSRKAAEQGEMF